MTLLKQVTSKIGSGVTPRGGDSVYLPEGIPLIRSQNIYNGRFHKDGLAFISDQQATQMDGVAVQPDDVLLNITGDSVARATIVPNEMVPARVNQHVAIIRTDQDRLLPAFLKYFLISPYMQAMMLSLAGSGGTRKALTKAMIEAFDVPTPPIAEQQRIIVVLSAYDDLIENNRRRITLLEQSARLLYREWFVHLRFPGHEHVKIVDGVPDGWERKLLRDVATLNYGKALKEEIREPGSFPVYGSSGIVGCHTTGLSEGPGIIVGRKGNVGSVYWSSVGFFAIDTVYFIHPEQSSLYLHYALQHAQFISTDVAVPGLNRDFAYSRPIMVPSDRVLSDFHETVTPLHEQIDKLTIFNEKLREARDMLLPRLMNGELVV